MTTEEQWKPIPGYSGYEASDLGRIRSYHTHTSRDPRIPHIIKPVIMKNTGRSYVSIFNNRKAKLVTVHRLVLTAFEGPCPDGMIGCHNDGNCANNKLSNLRWDTRAANSADSRKHGTARFAESHPNAKSTNEDVLVMRILYAEGVQIRDIARRYNLAYGTVAKIVAGESWKDAGGPIIHPGQGKRTHGGHLDTPAPISYSASSTVNIG